QGLQRYTGPCAIRARTMDHLGISVDCTFGDSKGADRVAVQGWGWMDGSPNRFLLDRVADRMDIAGTMAAIAQMAARLQNWAPGKLRVVLVEKKANGDAVITLMTGGLSSLKLIPYTPKSSKIGRARVTHFSMQAGAIWYPMPDQAPWVGEVVEQHVAFTGAEGGVDDDIDAESQLMIWLDDETALEPDDALERITRGLAFLGGGRKR
ncbi:MAG: phage terminase large subunit, partial [Baekduiaceae bacterium]